MTVSALPASLNLQYSITITITMSSFCNDDRIWKSLEEECSYESDRRLLARILELPTPQSSQTEMRRESIPELLSREPSSNARLRVIFMPASTRSRSEIVDLRILFQHYNLSPAILVERLQSVTHSFGTSDSRSKDVEVAWFHFLCKDVTAQVVGETARIWDRGVLAQQNNSAGNQASSSWIVADFVLHVRRTSPHTKGLAEAVTLLCFGAPPSVISTFETLLDKDSWKEVLAEPYLLFGIVLEELHLLVDRIAWTLADVFRDIEQSTLDRAKCDDAKTGATDFQGLHNVAKHCIFVKEAVKAAELTLDALALELEESRPLPRTALCKAALHSFRYRKRMFQSTQLRLASLEKRMDNIISLSFHLVTALDTRIMQVDSIAMKAIALLTLIFLPPLGIAQIFSTPFFDVDFSKETPELRTAGSIWIFVVVAAPLTAVMLVLWRWWYKRAKLSRLEGISGAVMLAGRKRKRSRESMRPLLIGTGLSLLSGTSAERNKAMSGQSYV